MIKNIKFFVNSNPESIEYYKVVRGDFIKSGFNVVEEKNYDLGIAIGGDGAFIRMINSSGFNSKPFYTGINTGHLGFLQEVRVNEHDKLISELKEEKYKVVDTIVQKATVKTANDEDVLYSLNEIVIRDKNLGLLDCHVYVDDDFLENFGADGALISTPTGSTGSNMSYGGALVDPSLDILQLIKYGAIDSKRFSSLKHPLIVPSNRVIKVVPRNKDILLTVDGVNRFYEDTESISCTGEKKVKCLKFSHYSFTEKINEKIL